MSAAAGEEEEEGEGFPVPKRMIRKPTPLVL
jgi:hypothetical protein